MAWLKIDIFLTILGGFLAAGAGLLVWLAQEKVRAHRMVSYVKTALREDLEFSIETYERLMSDWNKTKIVWLVYIDALNESRKRYYENKGYIFLLNENLRKKLFKYYRASDDIIHMLEYLQKRRYDLQRQYAGTVRDLMIRDSKDLESAKKRVQEIFIDEEIEYNRIPESIEGYFQKLLATQHDAQELLRDINSS